MRRLAVALHGSVFLAALAFAGTALADPLDPKVAYNAADQKRARAALLKQSDLGAAWADRSTATPSSLKAPVCPSLRPDYSKLTITGHAESVFDNGNGGIQVVSDVEVWKTAKQAKQHMKALLQPKLPTCIRYALQKSLGSAAILLPVKATKLGKFAEVSVSFRAPIGFKSGGKVQTVLSDLVLLRKGRTEIYINVIAPSSAEKQLTAFETRLAQTLVKRVRG
jgi:hypothetical protein